LPADRVIVFIDAQNVYRGARRAFGSDNDPRVVGQVDPVKLAQILCDLHPTQTRKLVQVRIYTGRPDATKDPRTYGAHMRQSASWEQSGATVIARPLRYQGGGLPPQEKGVDVALAVDLVTLAVDHAYGVGIVFSGDTDLKPALEYVAEHCASHCKIEVAAWKTPGQRFQSRLQIDSRRLWCHFLGVDVYGKVADDTNYAAPSRPGHQ